MYFNHAFKKVFVAKQKAGALVDFVTTGKTQDLTAGQIGLYNAKTYAAIAAAPTTNTNLILAQGSFKTQDRIGNFHGGYSESVKSKEINPKYVTRFFKIASQTALNHIISIQTDGDAIFECGKNYDLRVDVKGDPILKLLNHNAYLTVSAYTGCCADDCSQGCTGDPVDQTVVFLQWADLINADPVLSKVVQAKVETVVAADGEDPEVVTEVDSETYEPVLVSPEDVVAKLTLTAAYVETKFGNCTFSPSDAYELEPLLLSVSLVNETGEPCLAYPIIAVTEEQEIRRASGVGETVLRDVILFNRYLQDDFPDGGVDSLRLREILDEQGMNTVNRNALYDQICILHSVPRFNNPSGVFDNDQYLIVINVLAGTNTNAFTTLFQTILTNAGNGVVLENF